MNKKETIDGIFIGEQKNRFLCNVKIGNENELCYLASSCHLGRFVDLNGCRVLLTPVDSARAKTRYTVFAADIGGQWILLNLGYANRVVEAQLHRRMFSFLGKRQNLSREHRIGKYKADLYIHDTKTLVEIKCTLTDSKRAIFPSMKSKRAIEQLREISHLLEEGYRAAYILISLNPKVRSFSLNSEAEEFSQLFMECLRKGMQCKAFTLLFTDDEVEIKKSIPVELESGKQ